MWRSRKRREHWEVSQSGIYYFFSQKCVRAEFKTCLREIKKVRSVHQNNIKFKHYLRTMLEGNLFCRSCPTLEGKFFCCSCLSVFQLGFHLRPFLPHPGATRVFCWLLSRVLSWSVAPCLRASSVRSRSPFWSEPDDYQSQKARREHSGLPTTWSVSSLTRIKWLHC